MNSVKCETTYGVIPVLQYQEKELFLVLETHSGEWIFPSRASEKDESLEDTARMALEETTGIQDYLLLEGIPFAHLQELSKDKHERSTQTSYFIAFLGQRSVKPQRSKVRNFKWLEFDETIECLTDQETKECLRHAKKTLDGDGFCSLVVEKD